MSRVVVEDTRGNKLKNIAFDTVRKKYYVTLSYPKKNKNEKRIKKVKTFRTLKDARECLIVFEAEKIRDSVLNPCDLTLGQWLMQYLENDIKPYKAKTTYAGYCIIAKKHMIPVIGNVKMQELTRYDIKCYYASMLLGENEKQALSGNTVRKHHTFLKSVLNEAVQCEILSKNPAERVSIPDYTEPEIPYYRPYQVQQLLKLVENDWVLYPLINLVCYLGLRRGEALALQWENIDFHKKTIYICRARAVANRLVFEKEPKSKSSIRILHMKEELEDVLKEIRRRQTENKNLLGHTYNDIGYVVVGQDGKPLNPGSVSAMFSKFVKMNVELDHINLHGLRHTFASLLINDGTPIYYVSKIMGHRSTSITENVYTHLFDETHKDILASVNYKG